MTYDSCDIRATQRIQVNLVQKSCFSVRCVLGQNVNMFLVDTGSQACLLDAHVFMTLDKRPPLKPCSLSLSTADGRDMKVLGKIDLEFEIGEIGFCHEFIVAELGNLRGIIGMDFLENNDVIFQISRGLLVIGGQSIQLERETAPVCARVRVAKNIVVPPDCEVVVPAYSVGSVDKSVNSLLEPFQFLSQKGLLVARTLVNPEKILFSIVNISNRPVRIKKHTTVASVHEVDIVQSDSPEGEHVASVLPLHLQSLYERSCDKLSETEKCQLLQLLTEYQDIFVGPDGKFGRTNLVKHSMDTGDSKPIKIPPRRLPYSQREIVENEIAKMLENDVIEPSESPWSAPLLLVAKKDGSWRFCVDYRQLNSVTKKDAYPLPRIDESLDSLAGASYFSTLDLVSGYWQMEMEEKDKHKTAFSTHMGLFQFKVLPFGMCNAPSCYERLIELVLRGLRWEKCLCYLDDIIVFGKSFDQALQNLKLVFDRLRSASLTLKPSKCVLFQKEVPFLGHIVSDKGIQCDPSKLEKVKEWPVPKNVSDVRSFLGLAGYYRRFIPEFSTIASSLTYLTRKGKKFCWTLQCQNSFEKLKELLCTAPILAYPDSTSEFILDTDASMSGIGAVLSQIQNGEEKVIAYASRTLNKSQVRYCTTYKELLAVVTFIRQYRHFLWGRHFTIRTDHASLIWLKNFKNPEGILARWLSVLETYDFSIQHRPGRLHCNADGLSRRPPSYCKRMDCPDCHWGDCHDSGGQTVTVPEQMDSNTLSLPAGIVSVRTIERFDLMESESDNSTDDNGASCDSEIVPNWLDTWSVDQLRTWQHQEPAIRQIMNLKENYSVKPPRNVVLDAAPDLKTYYGLWESLIVKNNMLYYRWIEPNDRETLLLIAPRQIRSKILHELHDNRTSGHLGRDRTIKAVKRRVYWPGMSTDIKRWCKECDVCARAKAGPGFSKSPLHQSVIGAPLDRVGIDIVGPLPRTNNGNEYIIVLCDYFSKWSEAWAVPDHTALTVGDKIVTEFFCKFGCPKQLHSDQGREFESELFSVLCSKLGIQKTRTTPYRPQSDGLVERMNRTLLQMLSSYANKNRDNWDDNLPYVLTAYRSTVQESTGCSPNRIMLGRETVSPVDLIIGNPPSSPTPVCPIKYVEWLQIVLADTYGFVSENLRKSAVKQKKFYDRGLKPREFSENDFVWRWYPPAAGVKLGLGWTGPYKVTKKITDVTYQIQRDPKSPLKVVHVDQLKPYEGILPPKNWLPVDTLLDESIEPPEFSRLESSESFEPEDAEIDSASPDFTVPSAEPFRQSRWGRRIKPPVVYSP